MRVELHLEEQQPETIPPVVPSESWEQLDEVDLHETFLGRVSMLKSCPYFFLGRLRWFWAVALRERQRARQAHDTEGEERAWKLFGLIPLMLLHRPRGSGSLGRDELAKRADDFAQGQWHFFAIRGAICPRFAEQPP